MSKGQESNAFRASQYGLNIPQIRESLGEKAPAKNDDPLSDVFFNVMQKPRYKAEEQGIYHPQHNQTLKMRNNEMIEFFVDKDNGMRFDPTTQTTNMMANHYKQHIHHMTSWVTGNVTWYIKGNYTEKTDGKHRKDVKQNIEFHTESDLIIDVDKNEVVTIKGNATIKVQGNANIEVGGSAKMDVKGSMNVMSSGEMTLSSRTHIQMNAPRIDLN